MNRERQIGPAIPSREITPESLYVRRRDFMAGAAAAGVGWGLTFGGARSALAVEALKTQKGPFGTNEALTPEKDITTYNNFYEFGTDKSDPAENAHTLKVRPWTVTFEGE